MTAERLTRETIRLRLTALTEHALQAWMDGDSAGLLQETGIEFDDPVQVPPLFADDLPMFRDRMRESPAELGWWVWLVSTREGACPVGVCGLGGRPPNGKATLGYSVYPEFEGQGFATEASGALVEWVFEQPGARSVRATVPPGNQASVAVAQKLGMTEAGRDIDPEVGDVVIYELQRR